MAAVQQVASWIGTAQATNAVVTVTRAGPSGGIAHLITSISGTFSAPATGVLTLEQGATVIGRWHVHNALAVSFSSPVEIAAGQAVSAKLTAGGAGIVGAVNLTGMTL